jgi:hypothetical protein
MNASWLSNPNNFATPVVLYLVSELGSDVFGFEPETVNEFLQSRNKDIPRKVLDRTNAALGLFTSDLFWTDPVSFGVVCRSLNRRSRPFAAAPELSDISWGVTEASLLFIGSDEDEIRSKFSESVTDYVKYELSLLGIHTMPDCLQEFGQITRNNPILDPAQDLAVLAESQKRAAGIDAMVSSKTTEMMSQIAVA